MQRFGATRLSEINQLVVKIFIRVECELAVGPAPVLVAAVGLGCYSKNKNGQQ
ncbi:MAG: hypothetical protein ACK4ML_01685 [Alishewanella aestuarii]